MQVQTNSKECFTAVLLDVDDKYLSPSPSHLFYFVHATPSKGLLLLAIRYWFTNMQEVHPSCVSVSEDRGAVELQLNLSFQPKVITSTFRFVVIHLKAFFSQDGERRTPQGALPCWSSCSEAYQWKIFAISWPSTLHFLQLYLRDMMSMMYSVFGATSLRPPLCQIDAFWSFSAPSLESAVRLWNPCLMS